MQRFKWILALAIAAIAVWQVTMLAGAAPGAPGRPNSTPRPDNPGREAGPPASITLTPDRLEIVCDGVDSTRLTVRIEDAQGRPIADGTYVFFDVRYGFTDPVEAVTSNGEASTNVFLYPFAANFPGQTDVFVFVHPLRASIGIECDRDGGQPCGPTTSPACTPTATPTPCRGNPNQCALTPTPVAPCGPFLSPPCPTPTPCTGTESPPCPVPCGPNPSPPCVTPTPPVVCDGHPMSPPCPLPCGPEFPSPPCVPSDCSQQDGSDALYEMYADATSDGAKGTVFLGIRDLGGGPWHAAQWHLCFNPSVVDIVSVARNTPAPAECAYESVAANRVLVGCITIFTGGEIPTLDYFGDVWTIDFTCVGAGDAGFSVRHERTWAAARFEEDPVVRSDSSATCEAPAGSHTVSGTVCESAGGGCAPLRGATVTLEPGGYSATTSLTDGSFAIENVPDGDYTLFVDPGCTPFGCYEPLPLTVDGGDVIAVITPVPLIPTPTPTLPLG